MLSQKASIEFDNLASKTIWIFQINAKYKGGLNLHGVALPIHLNTY
jgi:hypothetical protein